MKRFTRSLFICLLTLSTFANAEELCSPTDSSWFFNSFKEIGLEPETINQCISMVASGIYNFEGELAYYGICIAELSNIREDGNKLVKRYNDLMKQCRQPQLFIAEANNPFFDEGLKQSCYIPVMNNLPSASIPKSCLSSR